MVKTQGTQRRMNFSSSDVKSEICVRKDEPINIKNDNSSST